MGRFDSFAGQQLRNVLVDQFQIQRVRRLVIVVAKFILGMVIKIKEVVVDIQRQKFITGFGQLLTNFDRGGGLAG